MGNKGGSRRVRGFEPSLRNICLIRKNVTKVDTNKFSKKGENACVKYPQKEILDTALIKNITVNLCCYCRVSFRKEESSYLIASHENVGGGGKLYFQKCRGRFYFLSVSTTKIPKKGFANT